MAEQHPHDLVIYTAWQFRSGALKDNSRVLLPEPYLHWQETGQGHLAETHEHITLWPQSGVWPERQGWHDEWLDGVVSPTRPTIPDCVLGTGERVVSKTDPA